MLFIMMGLWFVGFLGPLWYLLSPICTKYEYYDFYLGYERLWVEPNGFTYTTTIYSLACNIFFLVLLIQIFIRIKKMVDDRIIRKYSTISFGFGTAVVSIHIIISILAFISAFSYWRVFLDLHLTVMIIGYSLIPLYLGWTIPLMLIPIKYKLNKKIVAAFSVFAFIPQVGGPMIAVVLSDLNENEIYQPIVQPQPFVAQTNPASYTFTAQHQTEPKPHYQTPPTTTYVQQTPVSQQTQQPTIDRKQVMRKIIRMYENISLDDMTGLLQFPNRVALHQWLMSLHDDLMFTIKENRVQIPSILKEDSKISAQLLQKLLDQL